MTTHLDLWNFVIPLVFLLSLGYWSIRGLVKLLRFLLRA